MGHSYSNIYVHLVFSTKYRQPLIQPEYEERLKTYIEGIANNHGIEVLAINGTEDHLHMLVDLPAQLSVSKAVKNIKGGSSKWLNDHWFRERDFRWQIGFGAFSIHGSLIPITIRYIRNQKEHHVDIPYQDKIDEVLNAQY